MFVAKLFAIDSTADFSIANKLYAQGKFSDAATVYEKILESGNTSANLLFNCGNAEFKSGSLGKAIAAFRQAELLAPRNSEIRANLNFVRERVQGATIRESFWQRWFGQLSLNEWTIFAAVAFWLMFILLAVKQIRPALAPKVRGITFALISLTILFVAILSIQTTNHFSKSTAVVVSSLAQVRSGPFDDAQNAFAVHDGAELLVLNHHDDWIQVADGFGKSGWLPAKQVEILPSA
jgi:tetratricopeptide (TPR) repeat protein